MTSGGTSTYLKFMGVMTPRGLLPPAVSCQVVKYLTVTSSAFSGTDTPCYGIRGWGSARKGNARAIRHTVNIAFEEMYPNGQNPNLRQQPFSSLFAAEDVSRNVPSGEERGETVVFAGYQNPCVLDNPWLLRDRAHPFG